MKIKEYETGEHCFGPILRVNGLDYEELDQKEVRQFIRDMMDNDINSSLLVREIFVKCLEYLQLEPDFDKNHRSKCDQCGGTNELMRYYDDTL